MEKKRFWHGVDASNEESLFVYGFLIRWKPDAQEFQAIHHCGFDENGGQLFSYGWFDYYERWEEMDDELLKDLANMCGMTTEEYLQILSPTNLLSDLLSYQGIESTFGGGYYARTYTEKEIRKQLGRALCA